MNRLTLTIVLVLLGFNSVAVSYLIATRTAGGGRASFQAQVSDGELAQLDKIFDLVVNFRTELEAIAGRASYPTEKKKIAGNEFLQNHKMVFERARIEHKRLHEEKTKDAAIRFLFSCWGFNDLFSGPSLMGVPKWPFAQYNSATEDFVPYSNVSFAKLDSVDNEFRVLAISFIKDLK